ncbi:MAG: hypothetical protein KAJ05_01005, partial [Candidatus Latescibacteria bacterium]|nr:hypothetical protein [Candidatus Latescibacterota bacterium]
PRLKNHPMKWRFALRNDNTSALLSLRVKRLHLGFWTFAGGSGCGAILPLNLEIWHFFRKKYSVFPWPSGF